MNKFSFKKYENLVNDIDLLVKELKKRTKDDYTNKEVQFISHDIISVANSLNMCLTHYYRRNKSSSVDLNKTKFLRCFWVVKY